MFGGVRNRWRCKPSPWFVRKGPPIRGIKLNHELSGTSRLQARNFDESVCEFEVIRRRSGQFTAGPPLFLQGMYLQKPRTLFLHKLRHPCEFIEIMQCESKDEGE